jgi:GST-like protein
MIDLYTAETPNGKKITFALKELGLAHRVHQVNLKENEQKQPQFLEMNPNGRIPVIVDNDGPNGQKVTVFESGAILYYLAEKTGKLFGKDLAQKSAVMQWVMFQMSGQGPMFGNYYYGKNYMKPEVPAYVERFEKESIRLLSVMNDQLSKNEYFAGSEFTIADIIMYPWISRFEGLVPQWFEAAPHVRRWAATVGKRPAAQGMWA